MDKQRLKEYCIGYYENGLKYLKLVLNGFTVKQLQQRFGKAKSGDELLFHVVATPHYWMKRTGRPFEFRAEFETPEEAIDLWERQLGVFRDILENEDELVYERHTSVPWIMIRSCHHLLHHLGMIIYIRNILDFPPLGGDDEFNWGKMVDFTGDLHYLARDDTALA
jgi:hypothetical protein